MTENRTTQGDPGARGADYYAPVFRSDWECDTCGRVASYNSGPVTGPPGTCSAPSSTDPDWSGCRGMLREIRETRIQIWPEAYDQEHLDRCAAAGLSPHWPFFPADGNLLGST